MPHLASPPSPHGLETFGSKRYGYHSWKKFQGHQSYFSLLSKYPQITSKNANRLGMTESRQCLALIHSLNRSQFFSIFFWTELAQKILKFCIDCKDSPCLENINKLKNYDAIRLKSRNLLLFLISQKLSLATVGAKQEACSVSSNFTSAVRLQTMNATILNILIWNYYWILTYISWNS